MAVQSEAMMTASFKVLGRRWAEVGVRIEAVNVRVRTWEWMVGIGVAGGGSSAGGPRRLRRCLYGSNSFGVSDVEAAMLSFL